MFKKNSDFKLKFKRIKSECYLYIMQNSFTSLLKNYAHLLQLLAGILIGGVVGVFFPGIIDYLKPIGDIFLNLLFVTVVPIVFFSIVSAISNIEQQSKLGRIFGAMSVTFLAFILISASLTVLMFWLFPTDPLPASQTVAEDIHQTQTAGEMIVNFFTVSDFYNLFSRKSMLALLIFSFLLGTAIRKSGDAGKPFMNFVNSGNEVMKQLLMLVMKAAPVGLGAYIAYQAGTVGPQLFGFYAKPLGMYYLTGVIYYIVFFSLYAWFANRMKGLKLFWRHSLIPSLTAVSTCSSLATIPVSLEASQKIGVPEDVADVVIPVGTSIHKDGSSISSIVKIFVAFQLLGWNFFEPQTILLALGITVFVSMVEGGIPNGGYIGELLMISFYHLPKEVIPAVMVIGTLVDPLATILNSVGNLVGSMVVTRLTDEKFAAAE